MDNFNKVISFVLGLVVVIVFLAVITGKLNLRNKLTSGTQSKPTPTPTSAITYTTPYPTSGSQVIPTNTYSQKTLTTIPSTGSPTIMLAVLSVAALSGFLLKKAGSKN